MTSSPQTARRALRRLIATGLGALVLSVPGLACGEKDEPEVTAAAEPPSGAVETGDFFFAPAGKTIKPGDTVTWFNTGEQLHTVKGPGFASQAFGGGESYEFAFNEPGTYDYICTLHPTQMKGTVVVKP